MAGAVVGLPNGVNGTHAPTTIPPCTIPLQREENKRMLLEAQNGANYQGFSFGADKSVAGELVFQTGMVGYPESITDPSYKGQILVITFPLVGNYGVPARETTDTLLEQLPAHFEAAEIHVAGLVVASYAGEDYSHYLAKSSLGTWLKEQNVPAIYGVDTRALTKKIREEGSMLGRLLLEKTNTKDASNGVQESLEYEEVEWVDPNTSNLVASGEIALYIDPMQLLTEISILQRAGNLLAPRRCCHISSIRAYCSYIVC
jgi:carbamoyl-phosphate synthase/aspartate carbamoyltransferase